METDGFRDSFCRRLGEPFPDRKAETVVELDIHGVALRLVLPHGTYCADIVGSGFDPSATGSTINVEWYSPAELGWPAARDWDEPADADCRFLDGALGEVVVQRDFAAITIASDHVILVAAPEVGDGFHNFLRWLLPGRLLQMGRLFLHSAAVVMADGGALVATGPSGAGKSTLAGIGQAAGRVVLGDDMNVVFEHGGSWYVEGGAVGQALQSPGVKGNPVPLRAITTLRKGSGMTLSRHGRPAGLSLATGIANLFWERLDPGQIARCQHLIAGLCATIPFFELEFSPLDLVWSNVEQQLALSA